MFYSNAQNVECIAFNQACADVGSAFAMIGRKKTV